MSKASPWLNEKLDEVMEREPYTAGDSVQTLAKRYNLDLTNCLKLNANENLAIPRETISRFSKEALDEVDQRVYPQWEIDSLKGSLGRYLGIPTDRIVLGSGADQLIDHLVRTFSSPESNVMTMTPSYSFYKVRAELYGTKVIEVPLKADFNLDVDTILSSAEKSKICFVCSPNNPTGNQFTSSSIAKLVNEFPGVVVLDEAYAEFGGYNLVKEASERDNLVVLRTFSKAFGLAGLRMGYMVGGGNLSRTFNDRVQYPFSVPNFSAVLCKKMLENLKIVSDAISVVKEGRKQVFEALSTLDGFTAFPSDSNFILFNTDAPIEEVFQGLLANGLLVRKIGKVRNFMNCIRVTIGTPEMNERIVRGFKRTIGV